MSTKMVRFGVDPAMPLAKIRGAARGIVRDILEDKPERVELFIQRDKSVRQLRWFGFAGSERRNYPFDCFRESLGYYDLKDVVAIVHDDQNGVFFYERFVGGETQLGVIGNGRLFGTFGPAKELTIELPFTKEDLARYAAMGELELLEQPEHVYEGMMRMPHAVRIGLDQQFPEDGDSYLHAFDDSDWWDLSADKPLDAMPDGGGTVISVYVGDHFSRAGLPSRDY